MVLFAVWCGEKVTEGGPELWWSVIGGWKSRVALKAFGSMPRNLGCLRRYSFDWISTNNKASIS